MAARPPSHPTTDEGSIPFARSIPGGFSGDARGTVPSLTLPVDEGPPNGAIKIIRDRLRRDMLRAYRPLPPR